MNTKSLGQFTKWGLRHLTITPNVQVSVKVKKLYEVEDLPMDRTSVQVYAHPVPLCPQREENKYDKDTLYACIKLLKINKNIK